MLFPRAMVPLIALLLAAAPPRTLYADVAWAAFARDGRCEAVGRAQRVITSRAEQAHASFTFDRVRHGQLAVQLSHPAAPGGTVMLTVGDQPFLLAAGGMFAWSRGPGQEAAIIAAIRRASLLRVEARGASGARFVDSYSLEGAPGAIDAAAACAAGGYGRNLVKS